VKRVAGGILILALAACSRHEPPPAAKAPDAAKPAVGAELARSSAKPSPAVSLDRPRSAPTTETTPDPAATAAQLKQGEELFAKTCATCHMADGYGVPNLQPQIVGSGWISAADPQPLLSLILRGSAILGEAAQAYSNDMAPQGHLTDTEVAAVATYVRTRFAGAPITKTVTPAEVAIARKRPGLPE
jgi:mono/diheme cytochrome c family protein